MFFFIDSKGFRILYFSWKTRGNFFFLLWTWRVFFLSVFSSYSALLHSKMKILLTIYIYECLLYSCHCVLIIWSLLSDKSFPQPHDTGTLFSIYGWVNAGSGISCCTYQVCACSSLPGSKGAFGKVRQARAISQHPEGSWALPLPRLPLLLF